MWACCVAGVPVFCGVCCTSGSCVCVRAHVFVLAALHGTVMQLQIGKYFSHGINGACCNRIKAKTIWAFQRCAPLCVCYTNHTNRYLYECLAFIFAHTDVECWWCNRFFLAFDNARPNHCFGECGIRRRRSRKRDKTHIQASLYAAKDSPFDTNKIQTTISMFLLNLNSLEQLINWKGKSKQKNKGSILKVFDMNRPLFGRRIDFLI